MPPVSASAVTSVITPMVTASVMTAVVTTMTVAKPERDYGSTIVSVIRIPIIWIRRIISIVCCRRSRIGNSIR